MFSVWYEEFLNFNKFNLPKRRGFQVKLSGNSTHLYRAIVSMLFNTIGQLQKYKIFDVQDSYLFK